MKKIISLLFVVLCLSGFSQFPYSWTNGVDPGWVSSDPSDNTLGWQDGLGAVSTSDVPGYTYDNSQNTTYTSQVFDLSDCVGVMTVSFSINGEIENNYDYLYFEYTVNGTTWITVDDFTGVENSVLTYTSIPSIATQFRFRLETDGSVNTYCTNYHWLFGCQNYAIYYYDIEGFTIDCDEVLPIELYSFTGKSTSNGNLLEWTTLSESNNDYFKLEYSSDGYFWETISVQQGSESSTEELYYNYTHRNFEDTINYYRLTQVDLNGESETFDIISIDNTKDVEVVYRYNTIGQEVNKDTKGIQIVVYSNGRVEKILKK